jgi:hypothetical protein
MILTDSRIAGDKQTGKVKGRNQKDKKQTNTDNHTDRMASAYEEIRWAPKKMGLQRKRQTDRQIDKQKGRHTYKQANNQKGPRTRADKNRNNSITGGSRRAGKQTSRPKL